jgi:iron complex outermembrane recepter protein
VPRPTLLAAVLAAVAATRPVSAAEPAAQPAAPAPDAVAPDAAAAPRDEEGAPLGEEITVLAPARLADSRARGDGVTVQVIEGKELQGTGAQTLQQALQRLPGVNLSDEQGNPLLQDLSIRGLTASPVTGLPQGLSVFLDGVRVNEPAVEEVNFDLIPLSDVERVEIVRGPHAIFGRNTLGGAIHIVTRRGGPTPEAEVEVEGGSWEHQEVRARAAGPLGPLDGYLSLGELTERGWRVAGASKGVRTFGKLGLQHEGTDAALSYQFQIDRLEEPGSLPLPLLERDRRQNYTAGDFFRPTLHLVTANVRQRLAPGLSLAVNGFFRALDTEQFNASFISPDTRLFNHTRSEGAIVQLDHRASPGPLRSRLTAGAEATHNSVHIVVHEEPNANFTATEGGIPLPALTSDLSDTQLAFGAFLQEHVRIAEGPLAGLGATAALRFDRITHDIVDVSPDAPGKATGKMAFSAWVPSAGAGWTFTPRWLVSAFYSEGFRAPAFLELTCADPAAPCIGLQAGVAPDTSLAPLHPVRSRSYEVGVSAFPVDGVTASASAFRIDLRDDIYAVTAPGTTRVVFQNVGDTRRQGVELALRVQRGPVDVLGSYAYTLATFESELALASPRTVDGVETVRPGAELPLNPRHRLDLDGRFRALSWLTLSAGLRYTSSQHFIGDEANVAPTLAPYVILRAGAEARWRTWTAFLRAVNLLDRRYETFGTFAPNGRAEGRPIEPFLTPGLPLRLVIGLRFELS